MSLTPASIRGTLVGMGRIPFRLAAMVFLATILAIPTVSAGQVQVTSASGKIVKIRQTTSGITFRMVSRDHELHWLTDNVCVRLQWWDPQLNVLGSYSASGPVFYFRRATPVGLCTVKSNIVCHGESCFGTGLHPVMKVSCKGLPGSIATARAVYVSVGDLDYGQTCDDSQFGYANRVCFKNPAFYATNSAVVMRDGSDGRRIKLKFAPNTGYSSGCP